MMMEAIEALCAETHNYHDEDRVIGDYTIENGIISLPFLVDGQFFRIVGSKFNDGVYIYSKEFLVRALATWEDVLNNYENWGEYAKNKWGDTMETELIDEEFHGGIWPMRMPRAFMILAKEIQEYNESSMAKPSPYVSESFGGYSYNVGIGASGSADNSWQKVFYSKLKRWRKTVNVC